MALPGLTYKVAFILAYEGSPLGEVAYVDATGKPILFCVIANGAADSPVRSEIRDEILARLVVAGRSRLSGDRPVARTAGDAICATDGDSILTSSAVAK